MADQKPGQQAAGNGGNRPPGQGEHQRGAQQGLQRGGPGQLARPRGHSLLGMDPFSLLAVNLLRRFSEEMDQMSSPGSFGGFPIDFCRTAR